MLPFGLSRLGLSRLTLPLLALGGSGFVLVSVYGLGTLNARAQCRASAAQQQAAADIAYLHQSLDRRDRAKAHIVKSTQRLQSRRDLVTVARNEARDAQTDRKIHEENPVSEDSILDERDIARLRDYYARAFAEN